MKSQKTTNEIYEELHENLLYPALIYISSALIDKINEAENPGIWGKIKPTVYVIEDKTYNFIVEKNSNIAILLSKSQKLSSNAFALADYQTSLSENQFFVLLKKYKTQLDLYVQISELMNKGIDDNSKPIFQTTKGIFMMQEMNLKEHQKVIYESFPIPQGIPKTKIKWDELLKTNALKYPNIVNYTKAQSSLKNKAATKKQQLIIDHVAIQDYLIATVFTNTKEV